MSTQQFNTLPPEQRHWMQTEDGPKNDGSWDPISMLQDDYLLDSYHTGPITLISPGPDEFVCASHDEFSTKSAQEKIPGYNKNGFKIKDKKLGDPCKKEKKGKDSKNDDDDDEKGVMKVKDFLFSRPYNTRSVARKVAAKNKKHIRKQIKKELQVIKKKNVYTSQTPKTAYFNGVQIY